MQLVSFRVTNFRSINDSGNIAVSQITAMLGRNESGKTNLLRALQSLNAPGGLKALDKVKNFPKTRRLIECTDQTDVVRSTWGLNDAERQTLCRILPRADNVTQVTIGRRYGASRWVSFPGLTAVAFDESSVKSKVRKLAAAVAAVAENLEEGKKSALISVIAIFEAAIVVQSGPEEWAKSAAEALKKLQVGLAAADAELPEKQEATLDELSDLAEEINSSDQQEAAARKWVVGILPIFVLVDEYPELQGHQNIRLYLQRKDGQAPSDDHSKVADRDFDKLCKVADINPQELQQLLARGEAETRNQLVNRSSAVITGEIKRLWKDRPLKIRFNLDGDYLDTFISDPNSTYDVEVNLSDRSRGFQWFFSFYITFCADTMDGGNAASAILLLDEPGLYLHAKSQSDLLEHFAKDFENQIIYTTHSPFMVPTRSLDSIRTVNISEEQGTTVTNDPSGDAKTLFPLQAALGYNIAQSLFIGANNLVVEGVTDFWMLSAVSTYLADIGRVGLRADLTITPGGGAQKISYMVALLSSQELNVVVLLDDEKEAKATKQELVVRSRLISEQSVVFVSEAFSDEAPKESDIEDLFTPEIYESLVKESYANELEGRELPLNPHIPRIARRVESALGELGVSFLKTRPTRLLLQKMGADPASVMDKATITRFEALFQTINHRLEKHLSTEGRKS